MHRRGFLKSTGAAAAAFSVSASTLAASAPSRWRLLRADSSEPGAPLRPLAQVQGPACAAEALVLELGAFQPAAAGPVCEGFELAAVFDTPGTESRFLAARFSADPLHPSMSHPTRFLAGRAVLRRFELDYRLAGEHCREDCALTRWDAPLLSPGEYLLVGPDRSGQPAGTLDLRLGANPLGPPEGLSAGGFDCLALRIRLPA